MKKYVMLVIVFTVLLGACTAPVATVSPTPMPSATVQPSATPTATLLPSITPEPTSPPEPFLVQDGGLINEQSQAVELAVPLLQGIQLKEVRNLADGVFEAYDTEGRLMLVNDGTGWVLAPMGMKLQEGIWFLWDRADQTWTAEWNVADLKERIAQIGRLVDETLVYPENFKTGEMQCIAPELCFHMQVKPEMAHEAYLMLLDAFAHTTSPTLRKYWREIGFYGNTGEQLEKFLQTSFSPDGNPYWLPSTSPQGTEFEYVQNSVGSANGQYRNNTLINFKGGVLFDYLNVATYSFEAWKSNLWLRSWTQWLKMQNADQGDKLLISRLNWNQWGLVVHPRLGRLIFMVGSKEMWPNMIDNDKQHLGGNDGIFRNLVDPNLLSRYFIAYLNNFSDLWVLSTGNTTSRICPTSPPNGLNCDKVILTHEVIDFFEPQP